MENKLGQSLRAIAHRGPDAQAVWLGDDGRVGTSTHSDETGD